MLGEMQCAHEGSAATVVARQFLRTFAPEAEYRSSDDFYPLSGFRLHFFEKVHLGIVLTCVQGVRVLVVGQRDFEKSRDPISRKESIL